MSFRAPRVKSTPAKHNPLAQADSTPYRLVPAAAVEARHKPWGTSDVTTVLPQHDVYGPEGILAQPDAFQPSATTSLDEEFNLSGGSYNIEMTQSTLASASSAHSRKKERQWHKWATEIIPALLGPYLALLHNTDSLHGDIHASLAVGCECSPNVRRISVACVLFES